MPGQPNSNTPDFLDAGEALWDMGAGALRGAVAATLGTPGDILDLVRKAGVDAGLYKDSGKPGILPTTSRMEELLPPAVPPGSPRQYSANVGEAAGEWLGPGIAGAGARGAAKNAPMALSEGLAEAPKVTNAKGGSQRGIFLLAPQDHPALPQAKDLELKGVDPKKIWADTGLFRGLDDKWRYEVSDHQAVFKAIDDVKEKRKAQFDHLDMLRTAVALAHSGEDIDTAARMWRQMGEDVPEQAVQYAKRIDPADLREMHHQQEVVAYGGIHVPLTSALDHPKLYEKEPRLKSTGFLTGKDPNEISTANYYPPRDEITLNPRFASPDSGPTRSILHEVQHAVDEKQGAEGGANPKGIRLSREAQGIPTPPQEAMSLYYRTYGEAMARATEARRTLNDEQRRSRYPGMDIRSDHGPLILRDEAYGHASPPKAQSYPSLSMRDAEGPSLGDELSGATHTLKTLERLPQNQPEIQKRDIWRQLQRDDVTAPEKDILRYTMRQEPGQSIPAEQLVADVKSATKGLELTGKDTTTWAAYGLNGIRPHIKTDNMNARTQSTAAPAARTTVWQLPEETGSTANHFQDPKYFGHTRAFEQDGIPHVVEIQSDLAQKATKSLSAAERSALEEERASLQSETTDMLPGRATISEIKTAYEGLSSREKQELQSRLNDKLARIDPYARGKGEFDKVFESLFNDKEHFQDPAWNKETNPHGHGIYTSSNEEFGRETLTGVINDIKNQNAVRQAEIRTKLDAVPVPEHLEPMLKNWDRRLVRHELSRAAAPPNPEYEKSKAKLDELTRKIDDTDLWGGRYFEPQTRDNEIKRLKALRQTVQNNLADTPKTLPPKKAVRFADPDTVAKVEGWGKVDDQNFDLTPITPEEQVANLLNDAEQTGNQEAKKYYENLLDNPNKNPNKIPKALFGNYDHQTIYNRYADETVNYLKSLGAKHIVDEHGHGWWEVPVNPKEYKRTPLFSMAGATLAAGAALHNKDDDGKR